MLAGQQSSPALTTRWKRVSSKLLIATSCAIAIVGCVPVATEYADFDVEGVKYIHEAAAGAASPPGMVYFPFHGIYIAFSLKFLALELHIPDGTEVQVNDPTIVIKSASTTGPYEAHFRIQAGPHKWIGMPQRFLELPDPFYMKDDFTGTLFGSGSGENLRWFLFVVINPKDPRKLQWTPPGLIAGTVEFPPLTINGKRYDALIVPFKLKRVIGLTCAMCNSNLASPFLSQPTPHQIADESHMKEFAMAGF